MTLSRLTSISVAAVLFAAAPPPRKRKP